MSERDDKIDVNERCPKTEKKTANANGEISAIFEQLIQNYSSDVNLF